MPTIISQEHPFMFSLTEDGDLVPGGSSLRSYHTVYRLDGVIKTTEYTSGFATATTKTVHFTLQLMHLTHFGIGVTSTQVKEIGLAIIML